jgi:SAM-dependent methyltransferase
MHTCQACGGSLGQPIFKIPHLPLVDSFCSSREAAARVPRYSVTICECNDCTTIQIASPPDTSAIYRSYIYESSSSPDLDNHFAAYSRFLDDLIDRKDEAVLEIGANDGLLLRHLVDVGFKNLVAIDPSPQTALIKSSEIEVINDFFSDESVENFKSASFSIIIANNCFSHISGLIDVLRLCARLLKKEGTLIVEVQSTLDLVEGVVFDYIYHEHYFYHSASSFRRLANLAGLEIYLIKHVETKGGSYRFLLGHPGQHTVDGSVPYWEYREMIAGVHSIETWSRLRKYLFEIKHRLLDWVSESDCPIIGYGASATGTVFLNYMNLEDALAGIIDDNPKRQGLYAPGSAIPVVSLEQVSEKSRCIILAWRHSSLILPKLQRLKVSSLVPLPVFSTHGR